VFKIWVPRNIFYFFILGGIHKCESRKKQPIKSIAVICRIIRFEAHLRAARNTQVRKRLEPHKRAIHPQVSSIFYITGQFYMTTFTMKTQSLQCKMSKYISTLQSNILRAYMFKIHELLFNIFHTVRHNKSLKQRLHWRLTDEMLWCTAVKKEQSQNLNIYFFLYQ
jgi:hypothetical protein